MDFKDIFEGPAAIQAVPMRFLNGLGMGGNSRASKSTPVRDRNYERKTSEATGDEEQVELIRRQRMTNGIECV